MDAGGLAVPVAGERGAVDAGVSGADGKLEMNRKF